MLEAKLETVVLHLTPVCENKCEYCYMGDINRIQHPPFSKIEQIINEINKQGIKNILLGGGNPCTYPHLKEVVELAYDLGLRIEIMSNTLEFKDKSILDLISGFDTTILGPTDKEHDAIANRKGAYRQLISNIKELIKINDNNKIGIALNATPQTYDKLFEIVKNMIEVEKIPLDNIRYVMIQRIIPRGRASNKLRYTLKREHIPKMFEDIERIEKTYELNIVFEDAFPLCVVDKKYHKYLSPCVWGFTKGSINWNGDVSRCGADPRFQLGSIFEKPLREIWETSSILRSFRSKNWMPPECQNCKLVEKCRCGCPLSDITEKEHAPDILCPFRKI